MRKLGSISLLVSLLAVPVLPLAGQARPFLAAGVGAAFDLNDQGGGTGGGFGYQGAFGVAIRDASFGGEGLELSYGGDRKARVLGGFVRLTALNGPVASPYFVVGVGAYRFSPVPDGSTTMVGASIGPGALFRLGDSRVRLLLEARFHTTLNEYAQLTRQEFASVTAGAQVGF